jgi:DNA-binding transcriptional LysR family regulator
MEEVAKRAGSGMKVEYIETFLDLVQTRNFQRTAERLNVTQSTVSSRIQSLEKAIGVSLFLRGRSGAELTPEGRKFENYAVNIRLCWNLARQELGLPAGYDSRLRIAAQVSLWERLIQRWVVWLREQFPKTAIHVEADYSKSMINDLVFGSLDIGVVYTPQYQPDLEYQHLFDERFEMIATRPATLPEICVEDYVFVALSPHFIVQHSQLLPHLHLAPVSMGLSAMSLELLKRNGGAAYLPAELADTLTAHGEFHRVEGAPTIEQPVFVTFLSRQRHRPMISQAIKGLRTIALS